MRKMMIAAIAATMLCGGTASPSVAAVQVFNATGLFRDGGVLSGTVSIDEIAGSVVDAHLVLSGVPNAFSAVFFETSGVYAPAAANAFFDSSDTSHSKAFSITLPANLVGYQGGAIYSNASPSPTGYGSAYFINNNPTSLDSGSLSAAPEPASWAMMVGGFGLVGTALRRRKTTTSFA